MTLGYRWGAPDDDDCPPWCVAVHAPDDHPHDRKHVSRDVAVPVTTLDATGDLASAARDVVRGAELVVTLHRRVGSAETWVYLGDGFEQRVEVRLADMHRVVEAFAGLVEGLPPLD